ncbi:enolase-phosphatase E1-like isoform X2 [Argopecten irradians]|uniref:enolase-phosphatase E1-like isoform X2 n=1 Tax=Argopecten irradians TaxID=31199 RepID=UPI0037197A09
MFKNLFSALSSKVFGNAQDGNPTSTQPSTDDNGQKKQPEFKASQGSIQKGSPLNCSSSVDVKNTTKSKSLSTSRVRKGSAKDEDCSQTCSSPDDGKNMVSTQAPEKDSSKPASSSSDGLQIKTQSQDVTKGGSQTGSPTDGGSTCPVQSQVVTKEKGSEAAEESVVKSKADDEDSFVIVDSAQTRSPKKPVVDSAQTRSPKKPVVDSAQTGSPKKPMVDSAQTESPKKPVVDSAQTESPKKPVVDSAQIGSPKKPVVDGAQTRSPKKPVVDSAQTGSPKKPVVDSAQTGSPKKPVVDGAQTRSLKKHVVDSAQTGSPKKPVVDSAQTESPKKPVVDSAQIGHTKKPVVDNAQTESPKKPVVDSAQTGSPKKPVVDRAQTGSPKKPMVDSAQTGSPKKPVVDSAQTGSPKKLVVDHAQTGHTKKPMVDSAQTGSPKKPVVDSAQTGHTKKPVVDSAQTGHTKKPVVDSAQTGRTKRPRPSSGGQKACKGQSPKATPEKRSETAGDAGDSVVKSKVPLDEDSFSNMLVSSVLEEIVGQMSEVSVKDIMSETKAENANQNSSNNGQDHSYKPQDDNWRVRKHQERRQDNSWRARGQNDRSQDDNWRAKGPNRQREEYSREKPQRGKKGKRQQGHKQGFNDGQPLSGEGDGETNEDKQHLPPIDPNLEKEDFMAYCKICTEREKLIFAKKLIYRLGYLKDVPQDNIKQVIIGQYKIAAKRLVHGWVDDARYYAEVMMSQEWIDENLLYLNQRHNKKSSNKRTKHKYMENEDSFARKTGGMCQDVRLLTNPNLTVVRVNMKSSGAVEKINGEPDNGNNRKTAYPEKTKDQEVKKEGCPVSENNDKDKNTAGKLPTDEREDIFEDCIDDSVKDVNEYKSESIETSDKISSGKTHAVDEKPVEELVMKENESVREEENGKEAVQAGYEEEIVSVEEKQEETFKTEKESMGTEEKREEHLKTEEINEKPVNTGEKNKEPLNAEEKTKEPLNADENREESLNQEENRKGSINSEEKREDSERKPVEHGQVTDVVTLLEKCVITNEDDAKGDQYVEDNNALTENGDYNKLVKETDDLVTFNDSFTDPAIIMMVKSSNDSDVIPDQPSYGVEMPANGPNCDVLSGLFKMEEDPRNLIEAIMRSDSPTEVSVTGNHTPSVMMSHDDPPMVMENDSQLIDYLLDVAEEPKNPTLFPEIPCNVENPSDSLAELNGIEDFITDMVTSKICNIDAVTDLNTAELGDGGFGEEVVNLDLVKDESVMKLIEQCQTEDQADVESCDGAGEAPALPEEDLKESIQHYSNSAESEMVYNLLQDQPIIQQDNAESGKDCMNLLSENLAANGNEYTQDPKVFCQDLDVQLQVELVESRACDEPYSPTQKCIETYTPVKCVSEPVTLPEPFSPSPDTLTEPF